MSDQLSKEAIEDLRAWADQRVLDIVESQWPDEEDAPEMKVTRTILALIAERDRLLAENAKLRAAADESVGLDLVRKAWE